MRDFLQERAVEDRGGPLPSVYFTALAAVLVMLALTFAAHHYAEKAASSDNRETKLVETK